jgi:hypothetical protein
MANEFKVRKGLVINGSGSALLEAQGSVGQLSTITDSLSGSLFSINDISGIPVLEAFSDATIKIGAFGVEAIKVSGSFATTTGSLRGTASYAVNALSASNALSSSYALTSSYALNVPATLVAFNLQTGNYTLAASDINKIVRINSNITCSVTLPDNGSVPMNIGSFITIEQTGTGAVTAVTGSGVTILPTARTTFGQYKVIQVYKIDTNIWNVLGGII